MSALWMSGAVVCLGLSMGGVGVAQAQVLPAPVSDIDQPKTNVRMQEAVLAGGCFWGMPAVFQHVRGVESVVSGYSGGSEASASY
jgi:peptide-methionine (S)-S-oxide reductase